MGAKVFKSEAARARLAAWYDTFLAKIPGPTERRDVPTALGRSHVLLAGDESKPPLVVLHGSLASSAHVVSELGALLDRYRVVAPDMPGQSVKGPPVRVPYNDDTLPRWVVEVLDGVGVGSFDLFGVSLGGFAARLVASHAPERVKRLVLLVPAGVVGGSAWKGITRVAIPIMMYKMFPSERRLRRLFHNLFTTWDDDWAHYMGDAFRDFVFDLRIPPLATDEQLRALSMPTLVMTGEEDVSFPGAKIVRRLTGLVPELETELIAGSKHSPPTTPEFRARLADRVTKFLSRPH